MKNISIFAFSLIILFSACKKNDPVEDPSPVDKKLTALSYDYNQYVPEKIEYHAQGRVSRYVGIEDILSYTYAGSEVTISEWRVSENREVFNFKGQLNSKGNLYTGSATSKYILGITNEDEYTFEYNANDYMVRETQNRNQGAVIYVTDYIYNQDGNMTEFKVYENGVFSYGGVREYDTTKKDRSRLNWDQFIGPNNITGKTNQHMPVKYTASSGWFINMVYTYDNQGYPSSNTLSYSNGNKIILLYEFK